MIKAIVFDCFGVLVGKGIWHSYTMAGGDAVKDAAYIDEVLERANGGLIDDKECSSLLSGRLGISEAEWHDIKQREEQPDEELFTYIRTMLKPKYKIGLLSNVASGVIDLKIPADLRSVFDAEVLSADSGVQKPDPRVYTLMADRLGVACSEMVFTDDQARYLPAAQELGICVIQYHGLDQFKIKLDQILR
ncbi:HAD-IA family hydrolase [Candidatus Saccharibacteria bacterium]|nr:HAD-IA family hydrolase [Candidatus Saccharibacteria bacterium]